MAWKVALLIGLACLAACDSGRDSADSVPDSAPDSQRRATRTDELEVPSLAARARGDLPSIVNRGSVRFARARWQGFDTLPRQGIPVERYHALAERFANSLGLKAEWLIVDSFDELFPAVRDGRADVVVANVTVTPQRERQVGFTLPLTTVAEWVIAPVRARAGGSALDSLASLAGRSLGIPAHAAYLESVRDYPELAEVTVLALPAGTTPDEVATQLLSGNFDATVMDDNTARSIIQAHPELMHALTLPRRRNLAWAVRRDNHLLRARLDEFVTASLVNTQRAVRDRRDLAGIKQSGRLRMLTVDGPGTYYLWRGELMGFDYELVRDFALASGFELEVIVAPELGLLIPWLLEGRGDLIAAALTISAERESKGIRFTRPYLRAHQVLVTRSDAKPLDEVAALEGRRVAVNPASAFWSTLEAVRENVHFDLQPVADPVDHLIAGVEAGRFDVTVADSHVAGIEAMFREGIQIGARLEASDALGWAVHGDHEQLLTALNGYLERIERSRRFNVIHDKYFRNARRMEQLRAYRVVGERLSPFDELVRTGAEQHSFDWRLIVSQMYQESRFDPASRSRAGARGLMQVLPRTARELGVNPDQLDDPGIGVEAGIRYLAWLRDRFPATLPADERMWFSLAAYNAGIGHVSDARLLALRQGSDPDVWFGSVDQAMLLLSQQKHARAARHGWVRGSEPVRYVADIRQRYHAYLDYFDARVRNPATMLVVD